MYIHIYTHTTRIHIYRYILKSPCTVVACDGSNAIAWTFERRWIKYGFGPCFAVAEVLVAWPYDMVFLGLGFERPGDQRKNMQPRKQPYRTYVHHVNNCEPASMNLHPCSSCTPSPEWVRSWKMKEEGASFSFVRKCDIKRRQTTATSTC